jgi:hypothetical protein
MQFVIPLLLVAAAFDRNIRESIQELKNDLSRAASNKNIPQNKIDAACSRLMQKLKPVVEKNLSKFSLYVVRNVFKETIDAINSTDTMAKNNNQSKIALAGASSAAGIDDEELQLDQTLEALKREYLQRHQEYSRLVAECNDKDALIKDMRETSFSVRLRLQEMDQQMDQQSLNETTKAIADLAARLKDCCTEAEVLIRKIRTAQNISEEEEAVEVQPSYFVEDNVPPAELSVSAVDANTTTATINAASTTNSNNIRTGNTSAVLRLAQHLQQSSGNAGRK